MEAAERVVEVERERLEPDRLDLAVEREPEPDREPVPEREEDDAEREPEPDREPDEELAREVLALEVLAREVLALRLLDRPAELPPDWLARERVERDDDEPEPLELEVPRLGCGIGSVSLFRG